jgi:hypothetical protein
LTAGSLGAYLDLRTPLFVLSYGGLRIKGLQELHIPLKKPKKLLLHSLGVRKYKAVSELKKNSFVPCIPSQRIVNSETEFQMPRDLNLRDDELAKLVLSH